jgi:nucleoid DNA-binding protein
MVAEVVMNTNTPFSTAVQKNKASQEIIEAGQKMIQRANFSKKAQLEQQKKERVSQASIDDIVLTLAMYGGRLEVTGLGTFVVVEHKGYYVQKAGQKPYVEGDILAAPRRYKWIPARRTVKFFQADLLRDMLNENWFGDEHSHTPFPNKDFFIQRRNLLLD